MVNKALATGQKMQIKIEPSQRSGKPRHLVAVAAKLRAAGPHTKGATAQRHSEQRALAKAKLVLEDSLWLICGPSRRWLAGRLLRARGCCRAGCRECN